MRMLVSLATVVTVTALLQDQNEDITKVRRRRQSQSTGTKCSAWCKWVTFSLRSTKAQNHVYTSDYSDRTSMYYKLLVFQYLHSERLACVSMRKRIRPMRLYAVFLDTVVLEHGSKSVKRKAEIKIRACLAFLWLDYHHWEAIVLFIQTCKIAHKLD